eukprot:gnl/MRDRNA2_/MRDRNA2_143380_c0_seq1.p1 gnl/MRDRNA2_/MRDRNA2_143380_c0~~gnl/MRDRNA2_/MRDRNA2_143380_c0_seq1.p1  ORF type:complete len:476 (+),score=102.16 gnl/MRDRNA2_/MRDRNA2_143380_c0_seq1:112-1539(+)
MALGSVLKHARGKRDEPKEAWGDVAPSGSPTHIGDVQALKGTRGSAVIQTLVTDLGSDKTKVVKHWLLDSKPFNMAVYGTIILNSVQMGLATDHRELSEVWEAFEHIFTAIFFAEMSIKLFFLHLGYFKEGWNRMDFFLVWMSVLDNWIMAPLSDGEGSALGQLSVLRVIRILRVARMVRLLKVFKELFVILKGIIDSMRTIFWVCLLLVLTMYVCSILCVDVMGRKDAPYGGWDDDPDEVEASSGADKWNNYLFFGTITRSMYTLFNIAMGEESTIIMRAAYERQFFMLFFFVFFIVFMSFGVLNVIIGVIVDSTNEAAKAMEREDIEKIKKEKLKVLLKIRSMVFALDEDNSGSISEEEIVKGWHDPQLRDLLSEVELPKGFSPQEMLCLLDTDGDGELTFDEFITSFYRVIASDPFQQACCTHASLNEAKRDIKNLANDHAETKKDVKMIMNELSNVSSSLKMIEARLNERR